jgi:hypothetical protein
VPWSLVNELIHFVMGSMSDSVTGKMSVSMLDLMLVLLDFASDS